MPIDRDAAASAIGDFLRALGHDPARDAELAETPVRVARAFADELLSGYSVDVPSLLVEGDVAPSDAGPVAVHDIDVSTICPHHLLSAAGMATIAYVPGTRVLGVGSLARLVHAYARRLSLQETIGRNVVGALMDHGGARGAYCRLEMKHSCLSCRGAREPAARVITVTTAGILQEPKELLRAGLVDGGAT